MTHYKTSRKNRFVPGLVVAILLLSGCATMEEAQVHDENIQASTTIEVIDNSGFLTEQAKVTVIEPILREKLVPRLAGNKKNTNRNSAAGADQGVYERGDGYDPDTASRRSLQVPLVYRRGEDVDQ